MAGYLTSGEADTLMEGRPYEDKWNALGITQKAFALETGADMVDRYTFKGGQYGLAPTQTRAWPRYISDERIYLNPGTPDAIKYASILFGIAEHEPDDVEQGGTVSFESQGMWQAGYIPGKEPLTTGQMMKRRALRAIQPYRASQGITRG